MTAAASGNALLDAHVRLIRDAADLVEASGIPGLVLSPDQDEIIIQVPQAIGDAAARAAAVARLADLTGGTAAPDPGLDPRRRRLRRPPGAHLHRHRKGGNAMTAVTVTDRSALASALRNLKLSGMLATLDARLAQAHAGELGHLDFLQVLCQDEVSRRESMSLARRIRRARFESEATLEGFDFAASPKLPAAQIRDLAALRWLQPGESVILYGPVGVGKSHVAQALAHLAIRAGAEARFMKTSRVLAHLAGGRADRTWDKRLAELTRPAVLVLDDFGMRELTAPQADDLYELITERAGKSLILTSNRAPADWYPLFPNPVVAESLLDRLINNSHQCFMNGPSYRPNKSPSRVVPTGNTSAS
jgi:DNA replication protein DnaC